MLLPALIRTPRRAAMTKSTEQTVRWLGYNHTDTPAEGSFYDCRNISTELYPLMAVRGARTVAGQMPGATGALVREDVLYWTDNDALYKGIGKETRLAMLTAGNKRRRLLAMGAWVIVFPDGVRYNTETGAVDSLGVKHTTSSIDVRMCKYDKTSYTDYTVAAEAPTDTSKLWLDTSGDTHVLKMYSTTAKEWVSVGTTYLLLTAPALGSGLAEYDTVHITGLRDAGSPDVSLPEDGDYIVYAANTDSVMIAGTVETSLNVNGSHINITIERELPELDFVTECNNRLWGCSSKTNEILACKQGDPTNWSSYMGLSSDSYRVTVGAPGPFTGCIAYLGYVLFFKEDCLLKLFGTKPSNYQISQTNCRGVQRGSEDSLVIVNETLYYKSPVDVVDYNGGLPGSVSEALGRVTYREACGASVAGRYYMAMTGEGVRGVWCYDVDKGLWSREDDADVRCIFEMNGKGYLCAADGTVYEMQQVGTDSAEGLGRRWWAETGDIGLDAPDAKYLTRFRLRMRLPEGSTVTVKVRYDDGAWKTMKTVQGSKNSSVFLPVVLQRCDHAALRLEGEGPCELLSLAKQVQIGGVV